MATITHHQSDPGGFYWFGMTTLSVLVVVLLAVLFAFSPWSFGPDPSGGSQGATAGSSQVR